MTRRENDVLTWVQAVEEVFKINEGKPLSIKCIFQQILDKELKPISDKKKALNVLSSLMFHNIKKPKSRFVKVSGGVYSLKKSDINVEERPAAIPNGHKKSGCSETTVMMNTSKPIGLKISQPHATKPAVVKMKRSLTMLPRKNAAVAASVDSSGKKQTFNGVKRSSSHLGRPRSNSGSSPSFSSKKAADHVDIETPSSMLVHANMRKIVNRENFNLLPPAYRYQLTQLLPECDRVPSQLQLHSVATSCCDESSITTSSTTTITTNLTPTSHHVLVPSETALTNEFFAQSVVEWRDKLSDGEFTQEMQSRIAIELGKEHNKIPKWKRDHFEEYYGQKQAPQKRFRSRNQNLVAESGFKIRDLGYEAQLKKFKTIVTDSKQVQTHNKDGDTTDSADERPDEYKCKPSLPVVSAAVISRKAPVSLTQTTRRLGKTKRPATKRYGRLSTANTKYHRGNVLVRSKTQPPVGAASLNGGAATQPEDPRSQNKSTTSTTSLIMRPTGNFLQRLWNEKDRNLRPITNVEVYTGPFDEKSGEQNSGGGGGVGRYENSSSEDSPKSERNLIIRKRADEFGGSSAIGDHTYPSATWWNSSKPSRGAETSDNASTKPGTKETTLAMYPSQNLSSLQNVKLLQSSEESNPQEGRIKYVTRSHQTSTSGSTTEKVLNLNARPLNQSTLLASSYACQMASNDPAFSPPESPTSSAHNFPPKGGNFCGSTSTTVSNVLPVPAATTSNSKLRKRKEIRLENAIAKIRKGDEPLPSSSGSSSGETNSPVTSPPHHATTVIVSGVATNPPKRIPTGSKLITIECHPQLIPRTSPVVSPVKTVHQHFSATSSSDIVKLTSSAEFAAGCRPLPHVQHRMDMQQQPAVFAPRRPLFNSPLIRPPSSAPHHPPPSSALLAPCRFTISTVKRSPMVSTPAVLVQPTTSAVKWGSVSASSAATKRTRTLGGIKENLAARRAKSASDTFPGASPLQHHQQQQAVDASPMMAPTVSSNSSPFFSTTTFPVYFQKPLGPDAPMAAMASTLEIGNPHHRSYVRVSNPPPSGIGNQVQVQRVDGGCKNRGNLVPRMVSPSSFHHQRHHPNIHLKLETSTINMATARVVSTPVSASSSSVDRRQPHPSTTTTVITPVVTSSLGSRGVTSQTTTTTASATKSIGSSASSGSRVHVRSAAGGGDAASGGGGAAAATVEMKRKKPITLKFKKTDSGVLQLVGNNDSTTNRPSSSTTEVDDGDDDDEEDSASSCLTSDEASVGEIYSDDTGTSSSRSRRPKKRRRARRVVEESSDENSSDFESDSSTLRRRKRWSPEHGGGPVSFKSTRDVSAGSFTTKLASGTGVKIVAANKLSAVNHRVEVTLTTISQQQQTTTGGINSTTTTPQHVFGTTPFKINSISSAKLPASNEPLLQPTSTSKFKETPIPCNTWLSKTIAKSSFNGVVSSTSVLNNKVVPIVEKTFQPKTRQGSSSESMKKMQENLNLLNSDDEDSVNSSGDDDEYSPGSSSDTAEEKDSDDGSNKRWRQLSSNTSSSAAKSFLVSTTSTTSAITIPIITVSKVRVATNTFSGGSNNVSSVSTEK